MLDETQVKVEETPKAPPATEPTTPAVELTADSAQRPRERAFSARCDGC